MRPIDRAREAERQLSRLIEYLVRVGGCPATEIYQARDALRDLIKEVEAAL